MENDQAVATYLGAPDSQTYQAAAESFTRADELVINVARFPTVQAAFDAAPDGARLYFPPEMSPVTVPPSSFQHKANNQTVDAMGVEFLVSTWGTPVFLAVRSSLGVGANGHTWRIGLVRFVGTRGNHTGAPIRGSAPYCSGCAVWSNGDRNYVEYLRTDGMPTPIFFSSWDGSSVNDRTGVGNRIGYLEATRYNFALLFVSQEGYDWGDAYCHDDLDDSGGVNPTHAIYGSASSTFRSRGGRIGKWTVENNLSGAPFQLKFTDGVVAGTLSGNGSAGVVSIQNCHDFTAEGILGQNVKTAVTGSRLVELVGTETCKRPNIGRVSVDKATGVNTESVLLILDESGYIGSITVTSRNTSNAGAEVSLRGVGAFSIPAILVNARGTANRPVRLGNGAEDGRAAGWNLPNVRSVGGGSTYDPIPVEEFAQCYNNAWGDGNAYLIGSIPNKGLFRRGMRWSASAPSSGAPRGWTQTVNGALSSATWAASTAVVAGAWWKLANGRVIRYRSSGTTGTAEPNPTAIGELGNDGTASWEYMADSSGAVVSEGNL
ncbi:hypothetical protein ACFV3I_12750 [Microbacterium sp. NPDC059771]|uniref:hypothetical protein n=1 Tax=Microbacterium sp. NPDC059771 TaxID=3346941 RepID=UPI00365C864E